MVQLITATMRGGQLQADSDLAVPWWSFTKTVLAAAALVLVARGRLRLDAPHGKREFRLRQLLQHRAGLPDYGSLPAYHACVAVNATPWPPDEMIERAQADKLLWAPGTEFAYSNIGYMLVRQLIEAACEAPLESALRGLVLAPLGIKGVRVAAEPNDLMATAWGNAAGYHPGWVYHGLLVGPAGAAALLLHHLLSGGLLPDDLLKAMTEAIPVGGRIPGRPWARVAYGLGLGIGWTKAGKFVGHTGQGPGSSAAVYRAMREGGQPVCTAAVFAQGERLGLVEAEAVAHAGNQAGMCDRPG